MLTPKRRNIVILILAVLALLCLLYFAPRPLKWTMYRFDQEEINEIQVSLSSRLGGDHRSFELDPNSPAADKLFELLNSTRYRRTLYKNRGHQVTLDYTVNLYLYHPSGTVELIYFDGSDYPIYINSRFYKALGGEPFQQRVLDFLLEQDPS